jgi:hypothetical protein
MCVVSLTLHLFYPWGKCPGYQLNRTLDGPEIWPGSPVEMKNFFFFIEVIPLCDNITILYIPVLTQFTLK